MEFKEIIKRAVDIKKKYAELEKEKYGKLWTKEQNVQGFVTDVGELMELVTAKEGVKEINDVDEKLAHELADCLYSLLVIANGYGVDIEDSFLKTMDELEKRIEKDN